MFKNHPLAVRVAQVGLAWAVVALAGCSTYPAWLPSAGPSLEQVNQLATATPESQSIRVLDVTRDISQRLARDESVRTFGNLWGRLDKPGFALGAGDVIEVSVWETPPATLFGNMGSDIRTGLSGSTRVMLPEQTVSSEGSITMPFVGQVRVAGLTTSAVETSIVNSLKGKANQPQVLVRLMRNTTSNVTVVGEVGQSNRVALTARGERVLDAVAAAGGVRQPVGKITLQLTRGNTVVAMPLETVIREPLHNVMLQPGDVLTALHQPFSFTVLGATVANREVDFEAQGITLAQALGRFGGLQDARADARGVFIFRFEDPSVLPASPTVYPTDARGRMPVVYRVDLKDPASFFAAQDFPMRNRDVVYVANSPAAELQKFLNIVATVASPIRAVQDLTTN